MDLLKLQEEIEQIKCIRLPEAKDFEEQRRLRKRLRLLKDAYHTQKQIELDSSL